MYCYAVVCVHAQGWGAAEKRELDKAQAECMLLKQRAQESHEELKKYKRYY
jgi:hypothetical protein